MRQRASGASQAGAGGGGMPAGSRLLMLAGLSIVLVLALVGVDVLVLRVNNPARALGSHYYMALGDSLSFGYQPNLDLSAGFADDIFNDLRPASVTDEINYACAGETTTTMIDGGCILRFAHHGSYTGAQLQAAIDFLTNPRHMGRVSPITLEIGSNDVLPDWNADTCTASPTTTADLDAVDANLTKTIFPELIKALETPKGARTGDLHLLNYYNPYAKVCQNSAAFVNLFNRHLQDDAAQFRITVVDVYAAFGGDTQMASHVCTYTWYCDTRFHDIHPTTAGYKVIAKAVELALGLPGMGPLPGIMPMGAQAPREVAFWRRSGAA